MKFLIIFIIVVAVQGFSAQESSGDTDDRVWGGNEARKGQHKFVVSLQAVLPDGRYFRFCGGSIVADRWIITAAHCIMDDLKVYVRAGTVKSQCDEALTEGQFIPVLRQIAHPSYVGDMRQIHDIALFQLAYPLKFNQNVQPIRYARPTEKFGKTGMVLGWGSRNDSEMNDPNIAFQCVNLKEAVTELTDVQDCNDVMEAHLQKMLGQLLETVEHQAHQIRARNQLIKELQDMVESSNGCPNFYKTIQQHKHAHKEEYESDEEDYAGEELKRTLGLPPFFSKTTKPASRPTRAIRKNRFQKGDPIYQLHQLDPERQICAGTLRNSNNGCKGDSGGPLIQKNENGEFVLVGCVSFGDPLDCQTTPATYTGVAYYGPWIRSVTGV